jgi:hypothetical protein
MVGTVRMGEGRGRRDATLIDDGAGLAARATGSTTPDLASARGREPGEER